MAVRHNVIDSDKYFIIDPITRAIKNQSGKLTLSQYDHNSERFTFECPRYVDGHDMSLCNKIEIHYSNTGAGNAKSTGMYIPDDLQVSADKEDAVTFSWLISRNVTQHVGKLNFVIRFACIGEESVVEYAWSTGIHSDITIIKSIYNGEAFVEEYVDVLEMWKQDLYQEGLKISSIEQTIRSTEDEGINIITITMTDGSQMTFQIQNGSPGPKGSPGSSIKSIERTSGNGAPGTTDTYTITLTDGSTTTFQVYNGANGSSGSGSGDMSAATYDPQGKRTDIFKYVDDAVENVSVDIPEQTNPVKVEILETICENIVFDDNNPSYNLPSEITLDSEAFYYMDCYYYEGSVDGTLNTKYTLHVFTRLSDNKIKWASNNDKTAIVLGTTDVVNNWRSPGHTNVISIYKVDIIQTDPLLAAALQHTGYKTTAPGGYNAKAEGHKNMALGYATHAEGRENYALGDYSHAQGAYSYAYGYISHVEGYGTIAGSSYQHIQGKFNVEDFDSVYAHIVGNGTSDTDRSNAYTLDWSGNAWFAGDISAKEANVTDQLSVIKNGNRMAMWSNGLAGNEDGSLWIGSDGEGCFTSLYIGRPGNYKDVATKDDIAAAIGEAIGASY